MYLNSIKLKKIIRNNNINIVHVRSRIPAWVVNFIFKKNFKTISTFHNVYSHQNYIKKFYNKGLSKVDRIVAISPYVKSSISKIYNIDNNKITVINRGTDTDFFNPFINNEELYIKFLSKYNISPNLKIILYPARITRWKGQIQFLDILESLVKKKIICYFVGDYKNANYTNKFVKEIKKRKLESFCKILGNLSKDEIKMMYLCSDVIISAPQKPEGFGRIVSEGLAMKKIVLGYDFGGVKDQLFGLDEIYKVKPFDQNEMISKINNVFDLSNDKIHLLGEISRKHVIKKFSKENMLNQYFKLYRETI